jgi:dihydropteroate synthase
MGIVNVTPDSFFASARTDAVDDAIARGLALFASGADVVDVGGESTRPGAEAVSVDEELSRVIDVVAALAPRGRVSIDTQKPEVAVAAVAAGATMVNDVSSTLAPVAGELRVGYVAMHRQGTSATMQVNPHYDDVVAEVAAFLTDVATRARAAGVREMWLDPGVGFGKTVAHNVSLLAHTDTFVTLARGFDAGILIGTSRKRFLGALAPTFLEVDDRLEGSIATEAWALVGGASMVRVHDVDAAVQLRELLIRPVEEVTA